MFSNWKKQVDKWNDQQAAMARIAAEKEKKIKEEKEKLAREQKERRLLENLAINFQCHICNKPSREPLCIAGTYEDFGMGCGYQGDDETFWNQPGDLRKCKDCGEWTCSDCLHNEICRNCWSKRLRQKL